MIASHNNSPTSSQEGRTTTEQGGQSAGPAPHGLNEILKGLDLTPRRLHSPPGFPQLRNCDNLNNSLPWTQSDVPTSNINVCQDNANINISEISSEDVTHTDLQGVISYEHNYSRRTIYVTSFCGRTLQQNDDGVSLESKRRRLGGPHIATVVLSQNNSTSETSPSQAVDKYQCKHCGFYRVPCARKMYRHLLTQHQTRRLDLLSCPCIVCNETETNDTTPKTTPGDDGVVSETGAAVKRSCIAMFSPRESELLRCECCGRTFETRAELDNHSTTVHSNPQPFYEECADGYSWRTVFQDHIATHKVVPSVVVTPPPPPPPPAYRCEECEASYQTREELHSHATTSHAKVKPHSCHACGLTFTFPHVLDRHQCSVGVAAEPKIKSGPGEDSTGPFRCELCGKVFNARKTWLVHAGTHAGDRPHVCTVCGKRFRLRSILSNHMVTHSNERNFKCKYCDKSFTQNGNLITHTRSHTGERPFQCPQCGERFTRKIVLQNHMIIHTNERHFKCSYCEKTFTQNGNLITHMRIHTGEKPFVCETCGKRFGRKCILQTHVLTHGSGGGHECGVCGKRFSQKNNLVMHFRIHTGEKPYTCEICGKSFRISSSLKSHELSHMRQVVFSCRLCDLKFGDKSSLMVHLKTHQSQPPSRSDIVGLTLNIENIERK